MRKLLLLCLFVIGVGVALFNFQGLAAKGEFNSIVLDFKENIPAEVLQRDIQAIAQQYKVTPQLNSEFSVKDNVYIVAGDRELLKALKSSPLSQATEYIEPNYQYKIPQPGAATPWAEYLQPKDDVLEDTSPAFQGPNDPMFSQQWNLHKIGVVGAWAENKGKGTTVAVIDTGVTKVPDLRDTNFVKGYDFVNDKDNADDDNGHGTHVAGTIAQATNNNYGVAGIAYEANIMPLKVLSSFGGGTVADIAEAIRFAADNDADVINMSLGGGGESQLMKEAIDYAHSKGVVIIAAAGNESQNSASYPARYPHVVGVSATDSGGKKAPYSNFGAGVDISAPGGGDDNKILQETIDENGAAAFLGFQGTSMAAPHVAAVAALVKAEGVKDPNDVLDVLYKSAIAVTEDPLNHFGAGYLNAEAAVKLATQGQISFKDFFRWLRDNGYLNPRFWIDGGAIALLPKVLMVVGSYLLAWFLRVYFPFNWYLSGGLIAGSSGLFFLKGIYIFDLPQWPFRVLGSSLPELGNAISGTPELNPIFASVLIPFVLLALLLGHAQWKWFAIGSAIGVASCLTISAVVDPALWGLGNGVLARLFLIVNALVCVGLAKLAMDKKAQPTEG